MRIEKRFLAYGHDIDTDTDPLAAGLGFAVAWDTDFVGRDALLALKSRPPKSRMVSIVLDDADAVPLGSEPVYGNGRIVGKTTSAAFGYRVGKPIALAYLEDVGEQAFVEIDIARTLFTGRVSLAPVFDPTGSRMR